LSSTRDNGQELSFPLLVRGPEPRSTGGTGAVSGGFQPLFCKVFPSRVLPQPGACGTCLPPDPTSHAYLIEYRISSVNVVSWTPPPGATVAAGCAPGVVYCDVSWRASPADVSLTATVNYQLIATGAAAPRPNVTFSSSATAMLPAVCGAFLCSLCPLL